MAYSRIVQAIEVLELLYSRRYVGRMTSHAVFTRLAVMAARPQSAHASSSAALSGPAD